MVPTSALQLHRNLDRLPLAVAPDLGGDDIARPGAADHPGHVGSSFYRLALHGEHDIGRPDACAVRRPTRLHGSDERSLGLLEIERRGQLVRQLLQLHADAPARDLAVFA